MPVESGKLKLNLKGKPAFTVAESCSRLYMQCNLPHSLAGGTPWVEKKKKKKKANVLDTSEQPEAEVTPAETPQSGPTTTSEPCFQPQASRRIKIQQHAVCTNLYVVLVSPCLPRMSLSYISWGSNNILFTHSMLCTCSAAQGTALCDYVHAEAYAGAAGGKLDPTAVSVQSGKTYEQEFAPEIERAQVYLPYITCCAA